MTRISARLARKSISYFTCFLPRFCGLHRQLGLLTAAEVGFRLSHLHRERLEPSSVWPDYKFQASFKYGTAHSTAVAVLPKCSHVCANLARASHLPSKCGLVSKADAKKGADSPIGLIGHNCGVHSICGPCVACTVEENSSAVEECAVLESSCSVGSHKSNGDNDDFEQIDVASSDETETAVCKQSHDGEKLEFVSPANFRIGRRFRTCPHLVEIRLKLDFYSKVANLHGALEVFEQFRCKQQVRFDTHSYNQLLYLCSGAASGKLIQNLRMKNKLSKENIKSDEGAGRNYVDKSSSKVWVHFSPEDIELAISKGADILEAMLQDGVELDEATYTSIVRLAVAKNDGDFAFKTLKLMESLDVPPKLRSCGPLLVFLCNHKDTVKAYEFDNYMLNLGIEPDELMLDHLLKLSTEARRDDKVYSLLHRLRKSSRVLLADTVQSIEKWFKSEQAFFAGKAEWNNLPSKEKVSSALASCGGGWHGLGWLGTEAWQVKRTRICKTGACLSCGERLCTIDLNPKDTEDFAKEVAKLAEKSEMSPSQFSIFQNWIDKHGPFDAIIDGANVGLYNPVVYRGFNPSLVIRDFFAV